jgi:hypothetical protein
MSAAVSSMTSEKDPAPASFANHASQADESTTLNAALDAIVVSVETGIEPLHESSHRARRLNGDELHAIRKRNCVNLLPRRDSEFFPDFLWNYHLKLRANCYRAHRSISLSYDECSIDYHLVQQELATAFEMII